MNHLSEAVRKSGDIAIEVGRRAFNGKFEGSQTASFEKDDLAVGHHAIVTPTDIKGQEIILQELGRSFPGIRFITEEKPKYPNDRIVKDSELAHLLSGATMQRIAGVDPLDGTSQFRNHLYEWSISIGIMENGAHIGGSIFAPAVRGGIFVTGETGKGVLVKEGVLPSEYSSISGGKSVRESMVCVGPDVFFLPCYNRFVNTFSAVVRTTNCIGSSALGLALVAAGRVDGLVHPVQCPWDWFAGLPLVREAGGKVLFYSYKNGKNQRTHSGLEFFEEPDIPSYNSEYRNTAYIAGRTETVNWLASLLAENWCK